MEIVEHVSINYEESTLRTLSSEYTDDTPDYTNILKSQQNGRKIKYPDLNK
jgi:hypothetical protein